jgi:serine/threonine protein kinase
LLKYGKLAEYVEVPYSSGKATIFDPKGLSKMLPTAMSNPTIPNGTLIDNRYLIQKVLGQGGLGRTYLALDTRRFSEPCVLKEFAPSGSGKHSLQKSRALFKREAEILYHIQHPQIPNFLACFEGDGRLFLVQEYVNGQTYSDLLKEHRKQNTVFSEQAVIDWLNNLLPVLDYIHQCGIIHRDISPDNIMLPVNSHLPVLIDFGVGKQIVESSQLAEGASNHDDEISYVGKMSLVGKVGYAPHEQIRLGVCSPSSDLYALGVTAVVLLTCKDPSTLMNQYSLQWEWRTQANVSPAMGQILDKMLADTPVNRYQTVSEVARDLQQMPALGSTLIMPEGLNFSPSMTKAGVPPTVILSSPLQGDGSPEVPPTSLPPTSLPPTSLPPTSLPVTSLPVTSLPATSLPPPLAHSSQSQASVPIAIANAQSTLSDSFIAQCQMALAEYIGPMASLIIDEIIDSQRPTNPAHLVDLLMIEIPSSDEAAKFRQHLLG